MIPGQPKIVHIKCHECWKKIGDPPVMGELTVPGKGAVAMFWCDDFCYNKSTARWGKALLGFVLNTTLIGPVYRVEVLRGIKNGSMVAVKS